MHEFDWLEPATLADASALLARHGDDARLIAGGTALVLALRQRMLAPTHMVSLAAIPALRGIAVEPDGTLVIGALTRHAEIAASPLVRAGWPVVARMAGVLANPQVRNQGTIGGNLCYGDPTTDPPACLLAHEARVVLSRGGTPREIALDDFLVDYFETALAPDEVLVSLRLPATGRHGGGHLRHRRTAAEHRPMLNLCVSADHDGRECRAIRIALGATVAVARRVPAAEALLEGRSATPALVAEAAEIVAGAFDMLDDLRGSAAYRQQVTRVMARRHLSAIFGLEGGAA
jgi:carbon-monoxide dehydrogenase medium subunit